MAEKITVFDLEDGKVDIDTLEDIVNLQEPTTETRLSGPVKTWFGVKADLIADADAEIARVASNADSEIQEVTNNATAVMAGLGYLPPVPYAAGISVDSGRVTVEYNGNVYAPLIESVPFITSGTFETENFRLLAGVAASDLADPTGSLLIGYQKPDANASLNTANSKFNETYTVNDFIGPDDTSKLQQGIAAVQTIKGRIALDALHSPLTLTSGVNHSAGDSGVVNLTAEADPAFSSTATSEAMVRATNGLRTAYRNVDLKCNDVANGLYIESGGFAGVTENIEVRDYKEFGFRSLSATDMRLSNSLFTGKQAVADRTGRVGIDIQHADFKLQNVTSRYADKPLRVNGNTLLATGCHFYNGMPGGTVNNSTNISIEGGSGGSFCHTYLDKGRVRMVDSFGHGFFDTKLLFHSTPQHTSVFNLLTTTAGRDWPDGFVFDGAMSTAPLNSGAMGFISLNSTGEGSWSAAAQSIANEINLRNPGVPRIVPQEGTQYVAASRGTIVNSSIEKFKHSFSSSLYNDNTSTGPEERWSASTFEVAAAGMTSRTAATGQFTTATHELIGSRTSTVSAASLQLSNRRDNATWDDVLGARYIVSLIGATGSAHERVSVAYKAAGTTDIVEKFSIGNTAIRPGEDNVSSGGQSDYRFTQLWAVTGVVGTSDANEKQQIRSLSEAEHAVAARLKQLIRAFKFNDAVALKGTAARIHVGVIAQDVKAAFESEGLVAEDYAVLCFDEWPAREAVLDDNGNVIRPAKPAGSRYGIRYDELWAFIISAM